MRELLEALASGECTPAEAERELRGYVTDAAGRFDAARGDRRGIPEAILAEGKDPEAVRSLVETAVASTGRAIVTRAEPNHVAAIRDSLPETADRDAPEGPREANRDPITDSRTLPEGTEVTDDAGTVYVTGPVYEPPDLPATVAIVTGGTADGPIAAEAVAVPRDAGATIERIEDVGVACLDRLLDEIDRIRAADIAVVIAGREGALPTVTAGLVETPVIGVPTATGYGVGGDGRAALEGMLQSCTVMSVVNVDAGFVAGAQATLVARAIAAERRSRSDGTP